MLNVKVNKKSDEVVIVAAGSLKEILSDVGTVINSLYSQMKRSDCPEVADEFRRMLILMCVEPNSPMFLTNDEGEGYTIVTKKEDRP